LAARLSSRRAATRCCWIEAPSIIGTAPNKVMKPSSSALSSVPLGGVNPAMPSPVSVVRKKIEAHVASAVHRNSKRSALHRRIASGSAAMPSA
jgi:hypothetical protein